MQNKKFITIGSLTFDIFVRPEQHKIIRTHTEDSIIEELSFAFGEKIRVQDVHECFGGGASNVAVGFSRLGINTSVFGAVGQDEWANGVINNLKQEKIETSHIIETKEKTGFSVIINSFEGERTVLGYSGANHDFEDIDISIFDQYEGAHLCHLSGKASKVFDKIQKFFIKNPEKFLSWNPGKEQIEKGIQEFKNFIPAVDVIILNREESEEFTNQKSHKGSNFGNNIYDVTDIMCKFYENGFSGILVITDGRRGAQATDGKELYYAPIEESQKRVDTLGAGDAFCSGFCASCIQNQDLQNCLIFGTLNSANVVSNFGAQTGLLTQDALKKYKNTLLIKKQTLKL
ncbi:MAG: carbohydrate kinase family protein [Candidatus Gracilibacteria bacterium]|jgi:ribokinase|nr:carbohydrate kinase family protein [Candidatus Gracilibacteria bacterium]